MVYQTCPAGVRSARLIRLKKLVSATRSRIDEIGIAVYVDGLPGFAAFGTDGRPLSVMVFRVAGGRIAEMDGVTDPARLAAMEVLGAARPDAAGAEEV